MQSIYVNAIHSLTYTTTSPQGQAVKGAIVCTTGCLSDHHRVYRSSVLMSIEMDRMRWAEAVLPFTRGGGLALSTTTTPLPL